MIITRLSKVYLPLFFMLSLLAVSPAQANISSSFSTESILSVDTLPHFREVWVNTTSDVQFYHISISGLTTLLEIKADPPLKISLDCHNGFSSQLTLTPDAGVIDQRIFVRAFPSETGIFAPVIRHETLTGMSISLPAGVTVIQGGAPPGYYSEATGTGSVLKTQLHNIINNHSVLSYTSLWTHFETTDATFSGYVWDIYSDIPCDDLPYLYEFGIDQDTGSGGNSEGEVYNREHSMPRSWFGGNVSPMFTDMYHIYPVDKHVNAVRENFPFGMVDQPGWVSLNGSKLGINSAGDEYNGLAFEPIDAYKGDLARTYFYMITRYEDRIPDWTFSEEGNTMFDHQLYPGYEPWVIDMLLDWHRIDPVSQRERLRNDIIYQLQGNRNPFVDIPNFVEQVWGDPETFVQELQYENSVRVFPVPAQDKLNFESSQIIQKAIIYSVLGETIKVFLPYTQKSSVNLTGLNSGIYYIRFDFGNGNEILPFIKY